nr:hypothetical protein [Tanacetum cinerariifolium]
MRKPKRGNVDQFDVFGINYSKGDYGTYKGLIDSHFRRYVENDEEVKESSRKGQNRIKTGQKQEAWRSRENSEAVTVDRGRKTEENKKRMNENANTS